MCAEGSTVLHSSRSGSERSTVDPKDLLIVDPDPNDLHTVDPKYLQQYHIPVQYTVVLLSIVKGEMGSDLPGMCESRRPSKRRWSRCIAEGARPLYCLLYIVPRYILFRVKLSRSCDGL